MIKIKSKRKLSLDNCKSLKVISPLNRGRNDSSSQDNIHHSQANTRSISFSRPPVGRIFICILFRLRGFEQKASVTGITSFSFKCTWAQQEGRNFKSSSRILQRVRDLRYARCSPETRDSNGSLTTRFLRGEITIYGKRFETRSHLDFKKWIEYFFLTRVVSLFIRIIVYTCFYLSTSILFSSPKISNFSIYIFYIIYNDVLLRFVFIVANFCEL